MSVPGKPKLYQPNTEETKAALGAIDRALRAKGVPEQDRGDVATEAFLRAQRSFRGRGEFAGWAYSCAEHEALDYHRGTKREHDRLTDPDGSDGTGLRRAERYYGEELWKRVHEQVHEEWDATFADPWSERLKHLATPPSDDPLEEEARKIYADLYKAIHRAAEFAARLHAPTGIPFLKLPRLGHAGIWLSWWVPMNLSKLLEQPMFVGERNDWPAGAPDAVRSYIAYGWSRKKFVQRKVETSDPQVTARELALVSLLVGNRPDVPDDAFKTVPEVIGLEEEHMRNALKRHGLPRLSVR